MLVLEGERRMGEVHRSWGRWLREERERTLEPRGDRGSFVRFLFPTLRHRLSELSRMDVEAAGDVLSPCRSSLTSEMIESTVPSQRRVRCHLVLSLFFTLPRTAAAELIPVSV